MKLTAPYNNSLKGEIELPASKSISNRALIIQALCKDEVILKNISKSSDTQLLYENLKSNEDIVDCGMAGTTFRFLTAFYAQSNRTVLLTGSKRMKERPIEALVVALNEMGAAIDYTEINGFPPLKIKGKEIKGGYISLPANISSQFISAIMLIAPTFMQQTTIHLNNKIVSKPYIEMTAKVMKHFGASVDLNTNSVNIKPETYKGNLLKIEGDWSSAAFYYSLVALSENATLELKPLFKNTWQGDSVVADIFYRLGVLTTLTEDGILLEKNEHTIDFLEYDFIDCPDLAQVTIATCVGLNVEGKFYGLKTLIVKETNRIEALQNEVRKFGWKFEAQDDEYILFRDFSIQPKINIRINTYNDHRMAMAFAPLTLIHETIEIENPNVVKKSNPEFWNHLKDLGFNF